MDLLCCITITIVVLASYGAARATDMFWNVASGDYATGTNWNPTGPPALFDNAFIDNAGTATLAAGVGEADTLEIGSTEGASGTFVVTGGDFTANQRIRIGEVGNGAAMISGGTVQTPHNEQDIFVGGENGAGTGTLTVSGASTSVNASDDFILGRVGTGTLDLQGGWVTGGFTVVGKFGTGTWNQSSGVFEQSFGDVEIGDGGRPDQTDIEGPRTGTINLTGGVMQGAGHLAIGNRVGGGAVNVSGGALALTASVADGSIIIGRGMDWDTMPGAGGETALRVIGDDSTIVANGSLLMNTADVQSSSTLIARITGPTHTPIKVAGNADIGNGAFQVELEGYVPVLGNSWTIIEAGADLAADKLAISTLADSLTTAPLYDGLQHMDPDVLGTVMGEFGSEDFSQAPLGPGLQWDVEYSTNSVLLKVIAAAGLPGDYNNNGSVDAADYVLWRNGGPLENDPTPGVQPADYDFWRARFGNTAGAGSLAGVAVPEPTSLAIFLAGLIVAPCVRAASPAKFERCSRKWILSRPPASYACVAP
jgi:T5SS/PEP-CTERM-associated repeat protein